MMQMSNPSPFFSLLLLSTTSVYAADLPPTTDEWRENRLHIQNIQQQQYERAAQNLQQHPPHFTPPTLPTHDSADAVQHCLNKRVVIQGMNVFSPTAFRLPECVNTDNINQLSRDITAAYMQAGYPATKIQFIDAPDTLTMQISETTIRQITGNSHRVNIHTLFPKHQNHALNIHYLDQGIEQANKVIGNDVSIDIYPHNDGTATIELNNQHSKPWFGQITIDNQGRKPNRAMIRATAGIGSPFGLSGSLHLGAYSNMAQGNPNHSRGANVYYQIPYGKWTFSAYGSQSSSRHANQLASGYALNYDSQSTAAGAKAERVISRGQKHITYAHMGVDYLNILSEFGGSKIAIQSPKLGVIQMGLAHSQIVNRGIWLNHVTVERGTRLFGAKDSDLSPFTSQFTNFVANSTLSQTHRAGNSPWLIRHQHQLSLQHSKDQLYSTKQINITEPHAVRGFNRFTLNGRSGAYVTNTLLARRYLPNHFYVEPYIGADMGVVKDDAHWQRALGMALGVNWAYGKHWQVNVESAYGIGYPTKHDAVRQRQLTASLKLWF